MAAENVTPETPAPRHSGAKRENPIAASRQSAAILKTKGLRLSADEPLRRWHRFAGCYERILQVFWKTWPASELVNKEFYNY